MTKMTPTVYIPIEESNRELAAKLLIAGELLKHQVTVVLGRQPMVVGNLPHVPRGVVLFKGMNAMPAHAMRRSQDHGHLSVATDEEVLGLANARVMSKIMDGSIGSICSRFFAQGQRHADAMAKYIPGSVDKIRTVGNARLDILRKPFRDEFIEESRAHIETYGDYVLIDTNLGTINSRWGGLDTVLKVKERIGWLDPDDPEDLEYFDRQARTEEANAVVIRRTIEKLSGLFPSLNFVIRPHPAEREEPWRKAYDGWQNIHVVSTGTHVPWLLGCKLMLHTGCTTGIEAELLGVPTISFLPTNHETLICSDYLSHKANYCAVGEADAVATAASFLNGEVTGVTEWRSDRKKALLEHLTALDGPYAYQRIANQILEVLDPAIDGHPRYDWTPTNPDCFITTREQYEARVQGLRGADYSWSKVQIDQASLQRRFSTLNRAAESGTDPEISEIAEGVFRFRPR